MVFKYHGFSFEYQNKKYFVSVKRKQRRHYSTCEILLERIIDLIKFKCPTRRGELGQRLDQSEAFCCCGVYEPCLNFFNNWFTSCVNYRDNAFKFQLFNAHGKDYTGCCCEGYFRKKCTGYKYVFTSWGIWDLIFFLGFAGWVFENKKMLFMLQKQKNVFHFILIACIVYTQFDLYLFRESHRTFDTQERWLFYLGLCETCLDSYRTLCGYIYVVVIVARMISGQIELYHEHWLIGTGFCYLMISVQLRFSE